MTCIACHQAADDTLCLACRILFERARDGFLATPDYPTGVVVGVATSAIEENCPDWPRYSREIQEKHRARFMGILERVLDIQSKTIAEYAAARGLTLHKIVREITELGSKRRAARDLIEELHPGDHLILFGHASGALSKGGHPLLATCATSVKCAERGIRMHLAGLGLDLSKPLGQYCLRMAQESVSMWEATRAMHRSDGSGLFGLPQNLARWDARVRWTVNGVRSGLSPAELAIRGRLMYTTIFKMQKWSSFAMAVCDTRIGVFDVATACKFFCANCGKPSPIVYCRCGVGKAMKLGPSTLTRGVRFPECGQMPIDQQLLACWNFHRRINPGQDEERPWETKKKESA